MVNSSCSYVSNGRSRRRGRSRVVGWLTITATLIAAVVIGHVWMEHESARAARDTHLLSRSYGPALPIPRPPSMSAEQRRAMLERITHQGQAIERSVTAAQGASSADASALRSWNTYFATLVRANQR